MKTIVLVLFIFLSNNLFSQNSDYEYSPNTISRHYDISNGMFYQFQNLYDSGITSMSVLKRDSSANVLWNRSYYNINLEINVQFFLTLPDNGFGFIGYQTEFPDRFEFLFRSDSMGNILWSKKICNADMAAVSIVRTFEGGFLIALKEKPIALHSYLLAIDSSGNVKYYKKYFPQDFIIKDIKQLPDSNFLIAGNQEQSVYIDNITVAKINQLGEVLWSWGIGDSTIGLFETYFSDLAITRDSGFIVYGLISHSAGVQRSIFKFSSNGILLWAKTIFPLTNGFNEPFNYIVEGNNGSLIISYDISVSNDSSYLVKTDSLGNILWAKNYEGFLRQGVYEDSLNRLNFCINPSAIQGTCIIRCDSSCITSCIGSTATFNDSAFSIQQFNRIILDSNLTKSLTDFPLLDSLSPILLYDYCELIYQREELSNKSFSVSIFPNPTSEKFRILSLNNPIQAVEIYNMIGEKVFDGKYLTETAITDIIVEHLNSGLYFVKLQTEKGSSVQKLIIQ